MTMQGVAYADAPDAPVALGDEVELTVGELRARLGVVEVPVSDGLGEEEERVGVVGRGVVVVEEGCMEAMRSRGFAVSRDLRSRDVARRAVDAYKLQGTN